MGSKIKRRKVSEETRQKLIESHKGYVMPDSQKDKIKMARSKQIMKPLSDETKNKISKKMTGKKQSDETKKKRSMAMSGENHFNWKGGISPLNRRLRNSSIFKIWREAVFLRDNFTCQNPDCSYCHNKMGVMLHPHHIKSFALYPELRFDISNGITYCAEFHLNSKTLHKEILSQINTIGDRIKC